MKTPPRLLPLLEDGLIDEVICQLMSGKEADVFVVRCGSDIRCAKIYKDSLKRSFKKAGMKVMTSSTVESVDIVGDICKVSIKTPTGNQEISCDIVLSAAGVISNLENIGLEEVGIIVDKGKIPVNAWYETNIPGYYAIGDVTPGPALAHVATAEGIICVEKIAGHKTEALDYSNIPGCTYCTPEIASVGITEKKAIEAGY